jgi:hypothetical protein
MALLGDLQVCELVAALEEPREATHAYLAAALRATTSEIAKRRGDNALVPPPRSPDAIGYTFEEVTYANAEWQVADQLSEHRDLATRLRSIYSEDWDGDTG